MNGPNSEKSIRIDNLGIGYQSASGGKPFIRKGIFFSGCRGEMIALIGLNGIGKSTLLRTIAGLQKRLSGGLFFGEKPAEQFSHLETARLISEN